MGELFWAFVFLSWLAVGAIGGGLIGKLRGRAPEGVFFGLFLGLLGWLIILASSDRRRRCQECRGVVPNDAVKCMHCGTKLNDTQAFMRSMESATPPAHAINIRIPAQVTTCSCQSCGKHLEFEVDKFDADNPQTVPCPHCGFDTQLYIPARQLAGNP